MKKIKIICVICVCLFASHFLSCNDFLEKPVTSDVTIDSIFDSRQLATRAMIRCYVNLPFGLPTRAAANAGVKPLSGVGKGVLDNLTDLNTNVQQQWNAPSDYYYTGRYSASHEEDNPARVKYSYVAEGQWESIRRCWIIIENIDDVPDMELAEKEQFKAEAHVIIAIHYLEMFRHFGGVPKVTRTFKPNDDLTAERMTVREMIDWISHLIDISYEALPHSYSDPNMYGRITRLGALGVKARMLLFAASPLFNSEEPYMPGEASDKMYTWLGEKDNNLWREARDAADRVITEALANGYGLVQPQTQDIAGYRAAYRRAYHEVDNGEHLIITRSPQNPIYVASFTGNPEPMFIGFFNHGSFQPTQNWADMFPMMNGYDIDPSMPNYNAANGFDNQLPSNNRDPRFYESIITNNDFFGTGSPGTARFWHGGAEKLINRLCYHGMQTRKFHLGGNGQIAAINRPMIWPYLRLAEIYLGYAEAANQYEGAPSQLALDRVNEVRDRVGLPGLPSGMTSNDFHAAVMKERSCELGFESVRWFDMIRWKMEDRFKVPLRGVKSWIWLRNPTFNITGVQQGTRENSFGADIAGLNDDSPVYLIGDGTIGENGVIYERLPAARANINFDAAQHVITYQYYEFSGIEIRAWATDFSPKWYLSAFPLGEINKKYGLIQNPGW